MSKEVTPPIKRIFDFHPLPRYHYFLLKLGDQRIGCANRATKALTMSVERSQL
jgi:hypothetical protein